MPLTQGQLDAIELILNGDPTDPAVKHLNDENNKLIAARDDLISLVSFHTGIADTNATAILATLKTRGKDAANELVTLLT